MSDIAIRTENLSKLYRIGPRERYKALRDTLTDAMYAPFRRIRSMFQRSNVQTCERSNDNYIWALKDVCFEVKRGEVVGIIGRNGAGKTTLLKILSRITEPTEGYAEIHGRVGSLLEVGTGFHPELTGRENIYLNGAILGMKKAEIDDKFDEIVDFAEIEKFIDTPVKHYSSGMYVRLAFAVAAHLEPEILLVDEVLAVGDAAFQKKCLGKMGDVAKEGRTVLFVSHNMGAITNLCGRALLLDSGQILLVGHSEEVVSKYLSTISEYGKGEVLFEEELHSDAYFTRVAILDGYGRPTQVIPVTSSFQILFEYDVLGRISGLEVSFSLFDRNGAKIFYSGTSKSKSIVGQDYEPGHYIAAATIPSEFLAPGVYTITAGLHQPNVCLFDRRDHVIQFRVVEAGSPDYRYHGQDIGSILVRLNWSIKRREGGEEWKSNQTS
jgi:lipopolysaccharide transport system ATP-binding protein